ncbi:hypothetical protein DRQ53_01620 [bacterium]|nr:MAG: hypothetical protein DRQ53_01620 [bacterium]
MNAALECILLASTLTVPVLLAPADAAPVTGNTAARDIPQLPVIEVEASAGHALFTPAGTTPALGDQGVVIQVWIYDQFGFPVRNLPYQDIWLDDVGDWSVSSCQGGMTADANTDADGHTTISRVIFGGGSAAIGTKVWVNAEPDDELLPVLLVSPDINGDLVVDLFDFGTFGMDFGSDAFRSDLHDDGIVDLVDFGLFGQHFGETCP